MAQDLLEQSPAFGGTLVEPAGLDLGYATQDRVWRLRQARLGGYKLGLTTLKAQTVMGVSAPVAGRLADTDLIRGQVALAVRPGHLRIIEAELLFELGHDLEGPSGSITPDDIFAATRAFHAGIEICDARLFPDDDATLAQIVADNVYADKVVIGERLTVTALEDLNDIEVHLGGAGQPVITGSTAQVLGNPAIAVAWLANHLAALGGPLRAGMVIASGSCTGMVEAPLGTTMRADFAGRATATVALNPHKSC